MIKFMKGYKKYVMYYLSIILLVFVTACDAKQEFKGILWKVSDPKGKINDKEFYILGTMHVVSTKDLKVSQKIMRRFNRSSLIVFEADPSRLTGNTQGFMNTNLSDYIDIETKAKLVAYLTESGFRKSQIDKALQFHPYAILAYLGDTAKPTKRAQEQYEFSRLPKYPGVDSRLLQSAKESGKKIEFLETDGDVMRIWIETCPNKIENSLAIAYATDLLTGAKQIDESFLDAYLAFEKGDTQHLKNWFLSMEAQNSTNILIQQKCSVIPRNFFWKSKIADLLREDGNTLVLVGAAHLLGPKSLVELLRAEGYVLEEVE
jgi:uncharacterized protein